MLNTVCLPRPIHIKINPTVKSGTSIFTHADHSTKYFCSIYLFNLSMECLVSLLFRTYRGTPHCSSKSSQNHIGKRPLSRNTSFIPTSSNAWNSVNPQYLHPLYQKVVCFHFIGAESYSVYFHLAHNQRPPVEFDATTPLASAMEILIVPHPSHNVLQNPSSCSLMSTISPHLWSCGRPIFR